MKTAALRISPGRLQSFASRRSSVARVRCTRRSLRPCAARFSLGCAAAGGAAPGPRSLACVARVAPCVPALLALRSAGRCGARTCGIGRCGALVSSCDTNRPHSEASSLRGPIRAPDDARSGCCPECPPTVALHAARARRRLVLRGPVFGARRLVRAGAALIGARRACGAAVRRPRRSCAAGRSRRRAARSSRGGCRPRRCCSPSGVSGPLRGVSRRLGVVRRGAWRPRPGA